METDVAQHVIFEPVSSRRSLSPQSSGRQMFGNGKTDGQKRILPPGVLSTVGTARGLI